MQDAAVKRGKFIVFEGIDGCGKTTQTTMLCDYITNKSGKRCLYEREPDSRNVIGAIIRSALYGGVKILPEGMAYLHVADRLEHVAYMMPLLEAGNNIICDRYYISNMAYNSTKDLSVEQVMELNRPVWEKLQPDLVVFLDITPEETARRRQAERTDSEIYDADETQKRIRNNYLTALDLVEKKGVKVVRVDASNPIEDVALAIREAVGI